MKEEFVLKELKEVFPKSTQFAEFLRKAIVTHLPKEKWSPETVKKFIIGCRVEENGIPMFRTQFAGKSFEVNKSPAVLAVCWGGKEMPYPTSKVFVDIPKETFEELKKRVGDWKYLIERYGTAKEKELVYKAPVVAKRFILL